MGYFCTLSARNNGRDGKGQWKRSSGKGTTSQCSAGVEEDTGKASMAFAYVRKVFQPAVMQSLFYFIFRTFLQ